MSWTIPAAVVFGVVTAAALAHNWQAHTVWARVAVHIGLAVDHPWPAAPRMSGSRRGFDVAVIQSRPYIAVEALGVDPWFSIEKVGPSARSTLPRIDTGGWDLDEGVRVCGDRDFALGLLDEKARRAAEEIVLDFDGRVVDGKIVFHVKRIHVVSAVIDTLLEFAESLRRPSSDDLPPRLARNALDDPSKSFRLQAFRQLAREFSAAAEVVSTARKLLRDPYDELRLEAARVLLDRDADLLHRVRAVEVLCRLAEGSDSGVGLRRSALDALVGTEASVEATSIASAILKDRGQPREMRLHALVVLARAKAVHELLAVQTVLDGVEGGRLARALGRCGDVAAQPRLVELMSHRDEHVRMLAIDALGAVGDAGAVHPLRWLAGEKTLIQTPLARRVEEAVLQIRHRLGGTQAGEISIVDPEPLEGAVSVAGDGGGSSEELRGGEVSLAPEEIAEEMTTEVRE